MRGEVGRFPIRRLGIGLALTWLLAFACAGPAAAGVGVTGFFGNPGSAPGTAGGEFSANVRIGGNNTTPVLSAGPNGVAVNHSSGDLYVVDSGNNRIQQFDADGSFTRAFGTDVAGDGNERQAIVINAVSGNFTLRFKGETTGLVSCTASAAAVQAPLEALPSIGAGNIEVTGAGGDYVATFKGALANVDQPLLEVQPNCPGETRYIKIVPLANGFAGPPSGNGDEMQAVRVNAAAGQFRLGVGAEATADLDHDASVAEVQAGLNALASISAGGGSVEVSGGPGDAGGTAPYMVTFNGGPLAGSDVAPLSSEAGTTPLSGGTGTGADAATVSTFASGGGAGTSYEICEEAPKCKAGVASVLGGGMSNPEGIAINQTTGDLYVTDQANQRVDQFDAEGHFVRAWGRSVVESGPGDNPAASAVQTLTVDAAGGTFKLSFQGQSTSDLAFDASAEAVQSALRALSTIGAGNVNVTPPGATGGPDGGTPYVITFAGTLVNSPQPLIVASDGTVPLSGAAASASVASTTDGSSEFEICTAAAVCKKGSAGGTAGAFASTIGYPAVAPVGAPNPGNVLVAEPGTKRVEEFSATGAFVRAFGWNVVAAGPGNTGTDFEVCRAAVFDVCKAGIAGTPVNAIGSFDTGTPNRVAEDSSGNIYTVEGNANFRVQKFTPAADEGLTPSLFNPQIDPLPDEATSAFPLDGATAADSPTEIAVDPTGGNVFVAKACTAAHCPGATFPTERRVYEFTPGGALVDTHLASYSLTSVNGLAVEAGGKPLYLSTTKLGPADPRVGVAIAGDPVPPLPTIAPTTEVSADTATLNGTVDPEGGGPLHTLYRFEYSADGGSTWLKVPAADVDVGGGEDPVPVSQTVHGLQPNRDYKVRLVATKGGSPTFSAGSAGDFKTGPAPPLVETFTAFWDGSSDELVLRAGVNPNGTATTYRFEYGTEPCSSGNCALTPDASAGAGGQLGEVRSRVAGLEPEATYHYRVVAENGVGAPAVGAEATIVTPPSPPCANEALRAGASAGLPECRAYEWVSDGDSWGSGIVATVGSIADDGERAQFLAQAFGQPKSVPGPSTPYVAERTGAGWEVAAMVPDPERPQGSFKAESFAMNADLGTALWPEATFSELVRGEVRWTLVRRDGDLDEALGTLQPLQSNSATTTGSSYLINGAAADLSSFAFSFEGSADTIGLSLLPGEPVLTGVRSNLYEVTGIGSGPGTLGIVNRGGAVSGENPLGLIGGACGAGPGATVTLKLDRSVASAARAISADGSVTYFSARPDEALEGPCLGSARKRLYKRVDHTTTVAVSEAQCSPTPECPGSPSGDDTYQSASRDGEVVYFTTPRRLTNSDGDSTADLYLYDSSPPGGESALVQASAGVPAPGHPTPGTGAEVLGVLDNSADGSRVYFAAEGVLSGANPEGRSPVAGRPNLYLYERDSAHPGGRIAFLAPLSQGVDTTQWTGGTPRSSQALPNQGAGADGHLFLFLTGAAILDEDLDAARDLYRYDDTSGEIACLTCMGQEEGANVLIAARPNSSSPADYLQRARPASADGSSVVFITKESLLDEDLNGVSDVYIWRNGALGLISAGVGSDGVQANLTTQGIESGISPDGRNVFFVTRAALVGADRNNGLDLYDARVGGGFAEAVEVPECADGEGCHGPLQGAPPPSGGAGSEAAGPGNPPARKPCRKGKVRRGGKCVAKPRPHKKKKRGQHKRGGHERGGKR